MTLELEMSHLSYLGINAHIDSLEKHIALCGAYVLPFVGLIQGREPSSSKFETRLWSGKRMVKTSSFVGFGLSQGRTKKDTDYAAGNSIPIEVRLLDTSRCHPANIVTKQSQSNRSNGRGDPLSLATFAHPQQLILMIGRVSRSAVHPHVFVCTMADHTNQQSQIMG